MSDSSPPPPKKEKKKKKQKKKKKRQSVKQHNVTPLNSIRQDQKMAANAHASTYYILFLQERWIRG